MLPCSSLWYCRIAAFSLQDLTVQAVWKAFLDSVQTETGTQVVETWFKSVSLERWDTSEKTAHLLMPNQFVSSWIRQHYLHILQAQLGRLLGCPDLKFVFNITPTQPKNGFIPAKNATTAPLSHSTTAAHHQPPLQPSSTTRKPLIDEDEAEQIERKRKKKELNHYDGLTFSSFVVGPSNHLAYTAAYAVAQGNSKSYNPLFIYGGSGLGKTHLMHCIGNEMNRLKPTARIVYKTSDNFVDEFIRSIRLDRIHHFREKYRKVDLLMIDDVQFFSQKEQTQEAFFHIFNCLHESGKQIVLSSDMPPAQIQGLQDRLRSRLGWGLVADIQPPTLETKIAILAKKAESNNIELTNDVALLIASRVKSNIRELEGTLVRLNALAALKKQSLSRDLVDQELAAPEPAKRTDIPPSEITDAVVGQFAIPAAALKSQKRDKNIANARQILMYLLKKYTPCSLRSIGEQIGGRSHATVLHSITQGEKLIRDDRLFADHVRTIEKKLNAV